MAGICVSGAGESFSLTADMIYVSTIKPHSLNLHSWPHLVQAFVSRARVESFSLTADMMYVSTNAPRIARAVFEICLRRGWSATAELALRLCKVTSSFQLAAPCALRRGWSTTAVSGSCWWKMPLQQ